MATPLLIVTIQMKATEQYIPMVLFIMLYKVFQTFKSVDEIQKSDQLKKLMSSAFLCAASLLYKVDPNFNPEA